MLNQGKKSYIYAHFGYVRQIYVPVVTSGSRVRPRSGVSDRSGNAGKLGAGGKFGAGGRSGATRRPSPKRVWHKASRVLALTSLVVALVWSGIWFGPEAYYRLFPSSSVAFKPADTGTPLGGSYVEGAHKTQKQAVIPPQDQSLPDGQWLIIPRIGVRTQIEEGSDSWSAMEKGVWRVPEYGQPGDTSKPMILTSHRFGFKWWWEGDYWKYHSFYLLPDVEPGDLVEVIADKRKYTYEVYGAEEGKDISDYQADAILYTCKFLNSDVRYFRYLRLVDTTKDTQASL